MRSRPATALLLLLHALVLAVGADRTACRNAAACHIAGHGAAEQQAAVTAAAPGHRPLPRVLPGKGDLLVLQAPTAGHAGQTLLPVAASPHGPADTLPGALAGHGLPASAIAAITPARAPPSRLAVTFPYPVSVSRA